MDYAIVEIGGGQHKVKKGDVVWAESSLGRAKKTVKISKILMCHTGKKVEFGNPYVKGANISCEVIGQRKAKKVIVYKYRRRKSSKFKKGHRRMLIGLKINEIEMP